MPTHRARRTPDGPEETTAEEVAEFTVHDKAMVRCKDLLSEEAHDAEYLGCLAC